jgi:hypothetical protein
VRIRRVWDHDEDPLADLGDARAVLYVGGTRDRDSVLGRYAIDAEGHTTSTAYGRLAVVDGALAWDV